jgi:hypothetical protein
MKRIVAVLLMLSSVIALIRWYNREVLLEGDATVHLQSEHEHFHLHVDLPAQMEIQPGDTLHILAKPPVEHETHGEISYPSRVHLYKASWLRRNLVKQSSLVEISELVEHP